MSQSYAPNQYRLLSVRVLFATIGMLILLGLTPAAQILSLGFLCLCLVNVGLALAKRTHKNISLLFLLGLALPLVPICGSGTLLLLATLCIVFEPKILQTANINWAAPLIFLLSSWVICEWIFGFDVKPWQALLATEEGVRWSSVHNVLAWQRLAPPQYLFSTQMLLRFIVMLLLFSHFSANDQSRTTFRRGIMVALPFAAVLVLCQLCGVGGEVLLNQTAYWSSIGRYAGTFSDPNAFGIVVVLMLPLIMWEAVRATDHRRRYALAMLALVWMLLGFYSGSRSLFLGLFVYLLYYLYRKGFRYICAGLAIASMAVLAFNYFPVFDLLSSAGTEVLPVGVNRLLESITWSRVEEALYSRVVFFKIASSVWLDHILLGVGYGGFRSLVVPYVSALNLKTGLWVDNANNFYLGLLAEIGLIGTLTLLISFSKLRWKAYLGAEYALLRSSVVCLLVLLLVGPHLDFDEVALLAALLASSVLYVEHTTWARLHWALVGVMLFLVILGRAYFGTYGFYAWEKEGALFFRWTGSEASAFVSCDKGESSELVIRAVNPDIGINPLKVSIKTALEPDKSVVLSSAKLERIPLSCLASANASGKFRVVYPKLYYTITTSRAWMPKRFGMGEDARMLGVQVFTDNPSNLLHTRR
ncbi:O-antigen ligase family protein [Oligoflexia bacterium]|nr:O-antigen ligase family protein [Oligoflexia bacterium]